MRKNFGVKPWCYPQPVFILAAYDENGIANAMNVAWGGIHYDDQIAMCISANHKTTENILASKAFTVSMADVKNLIACDYVGIVSGNKVADKFAKAGFTSTKSDFVNAPVINELPMTIECELVSYNPESCTLIGRIINVSADESILDKDGKIDPAKLSPITFDPVHNEYRVIGERVGKAFGDGLKLK
ncbi:MAG: flavin reductase family protein [Muribaculaceae bacterium]|nr:flavin reductase family protein [Muribaculaceae bacterium]